jgi:putative tryptophan/tyrosine transport system substrate-binding protein
MSGVTRGHMQRREFITLLGGAAAAPLGASAQEPGQTYRLGSVQPNPRDGPHFVAFFDELRRLGFIEGQNLTVDGRGYGLHIDQFAEIAAEMVRAKVDVILCAGDVAARAAQQATTTIPIVAVTDDMVASGLVPALAKPGGNTTGVSIFATELDGKRQELLIEALPGLRRMAALADTTQPLRGALQVAAHARGIELFIQPVAKPEEIAPAIDAAKASGAAALNVLATPLFFVNRRIIYERAAALRLPAIYQFPEMAEEGGLIAYGPRLDQIYRELVAKQVVKLLRGLKPADLPVEQPTKFEFVINLKTAKAIGHDIPAGLVLRADKLIE